MPLQPELARVVSAHRASTVFANPEARKEVTKLMTEARATGKIRHEGDMAGNPSVLKIVPSMATLHGDLAVFTA